MARYLNFVFILDAAPDITQFNNTRRGADRVTRYVNVSQTEPGDTSELISNRRHAKSHKNLLALFSVHCFEN